MAVGTKEKAAIAHQTCCFTGRGCAVMVWGGAVPCPWHMGGMKGVCWMSSSHVCVPVHASPGLESVVNR